MFGKQDKWALLRYVLKPCDTDFKEGIKGNRCRSNNNAKDNPASLLNIVIHRLLFLDHLENSKSIIMIQGFEDPITISSPFKGKK
jgi:hypothetical protein